MTPLPDDAFDRCAAPPFVPSGRRHLVVCGAPVELLWLPERRQRRGRPAADRPAFAPSVVERIVAEEAVWEDAELALTPNRFPFAARQLVLWSKRALREPDAALLEPALAFADRHGATVLVNTVGAAASVPRAHLHLLAEPLPFGAALPFGPWAAGTTLGLQSVRVARAAPPFPALLVELRGPAGARARAAARLLELRTTPAVNLVDHGGRTWVFPRSAIETPGTGFPQALGAAELAGRWCFHDEAPFRHADPDALTEALRRAGCARS